MAAQLRLIAQGYGRMAELQRRILVDMERLRQDISGAVTSAIGEVQFQDVLRQRLECVVRGLTTLKDADADAAFETMRAGDTIGSKVEALELF